MSERPHEIKAAFVDGIGPSSYRQWRATMLGRVTESLEQRLVLELIGPSHDKRVLDLGCGDGVLTSRMAAHGASAVGIDVDDSMLRAATDTIEPGAIGIPTFVRGRIEALPFVDDSFDVIIAVTVLCLVPDPAVVIREAARILRPGGRLVIGELGRWSVWAACRRLRGWLGARLWRSARFSSATDLSRLVAGAGLTVDMIRGSVYYPPLGLLASPMAPLDWWLGRRTTVGAAFVAVAATKKPWEPAEENVARLRRGKFPHHCETLRSGSRRAKQ